MHLRQHGFQVDAQNVHDIYAVKRTHGVPRTLQSCHTALVAGYVVEGHVPAEEIDRLLRERPRAAGLAVPGMPPGSPGMEVPGQAPARYNVLAFDRSGTVTVFARR